MNRISGVLFYYVVTIYGTCNAIYHVQRFVRLRYYFPKYVVLNVCIPVWTITKADGASVTLWVYTHMLPGSVIG